MINPSVAKALARTERRKSCVQVVFLWFAM